MRAHRWIAIALTVVFVVSGCRVGDPGGPASTAPGAPSSPASAGASASADTPSPSASDASSDTAGDEELERRLGRISGVEDATALPAEDDLDCEAAHQNGTVLDIVFTARDAPAMQRALLAGRTALKDLDADYICVAGTFAGTGDTIMVEVNADFVDKDGSTGKTWPSAAMLKRLVGTATDHRPKVGSTHLYWSAETPDAATSDLQVRTDPDEDSPSQRRAISIFRAIEDQWKPPDDYDRAGILITSKEGSLSSTQTGHLSRWKVRIPKPMIDLYAETADKLGDASIARRMSADGEIHDQFDFLYPLDDEAKVGWATRQRTAQKVIKTHIALPDSERADAIAIRSGRRTALDFDSSGCEGILPGQNNRQTKDQTRRIYDWYAAHYPQQAKKDGVQHC